MSPSKTAPEILAAADIERLTSDALKELPKSADEAMFVAFVAPWCKVCAEAAERIIEIARDLDDGVTMKHVDTDALPAETEKLRVRSVPAVVLYAKGREVARITGLSTSDELDVFTVRAIADIGSDGKEDKDSDDASSPDDAPKDCEDSGDPKK